MTLNTVIIISDDIFISIYLWVHVDFIEQFDNSLIYTVSSFLNLPPLYQLLEVQFQTQHCFALKSLQHHQLSALAVETQEEVLHSRHLQTRVYLEQNLSKTCVCLYYTTSILDGLWNEPPLPINNNNVTLKLIETFISYKLFYEINTLLLFIHILLCQFENYKTSNYCRV